MSFWELAPVVCFAAIAVTAFTLAGKVRKPAPLLSDGAVDAIFEAMVQDLESKGGAS
jgi:hypothetical protein